MSPMQIQTKDISTIQNQIQNQTVDGMELENMVGVALLNDLNGQLADISNQMGSQIEEKDGIRWEMTNIQYLGQDNKPKTIEGENYHDLTRDEAVLLGVLNTAIPQTDESGKVTSYRLKEEEFKEATQTAIEIREEMLSELNSNSEVTMLKIQSLIDQRKNALTLLSNLLAASNDIAKNIIGNIRN